MKPKFKPGDVVEFNNEMLDIDWCEAIIELNATKVFVIASDVTVHLGNTHDCVHLARLDGKPIRWDKKKIGSEQQYGIWSGWLRKDKFLTAVHKAQKKRKRKELHA